MDFFVEFSVPSPFIKAQGPVWVVLCWVLENVWYILSIIVSLREKMKRIVIMVVLEQFDRASAPAKLD